MKNKCKTMCTPLRTGLVIGSVVALAAVLINKECRTKVVTKVNCAKACTTDAISFVRENREQIFDQIKSTASEVSEVVQGISKDVKQMREAATHLKEGSEEIVQATKEAAIEIKELK